MKIIQLISFVCFFSLFIKPSAQITQQIISTELRDQKIYITYNLNFTAAMCHVKLFVSKDEGRNFEGPLKSVRGNIGPYQTIGSNKLIVWDLLKEKDIFSEDWIFKIEAEIQKNIPNDSEIIMFVIPEESELNESDDEQIFDVAGENPEFNGGWIKFHEYLIENLKYPEIAKLCNKT